MPTVIQGDFEWDADKNASNSEKHGIWFEDAVVVFAQIHYLSPSLRHESGEVRFFAVGIWETKEITVFFTWRGERRRIISARRARHEEREIYRDFTGA